MMRIRPAELLPVAAFAVAFSLVPLRLLQGFAGMPGDLGDARLNNYFLENVYQVLLGRAESLWQLSFFFPFPWVIGFSDNLFGTAPIYAAFRALGAPADTAFQLWFMVGYAANYGAACYAFRRLGGSIPAATTGALIFAFALPTTADWSHAQLHFRCGVPLAAVFLAEFLESGRWRALTISVAWLAWQFYAGIYIGFFTLFLLAAMAAAHVIAAILRTRSLRATARRLGSGWRSLGVPGRLLEAGLLVLLLAALGLLFYPYLQVTRLYGATRSWDEIVGMLPRPQSYLLADRSEIWAHRSWSAFAELPARHEHQMFVGAVPLLLAVAGCLMSGWSAAGRRARVLGGAMAIMILLTLDVGGLSPWYLFHRLPLVSAIRAVSRIDQVLLFPVAALAVAAIDGARRWGALVPAVLAVAVWPLALSEMAFTRPLTTARDGWRERLALAEQAVPSGLPGRPILFMAQRRGPPHADELDAMWVALRRGLPTLNGYSGGTPPGVEMRFGTDCSEAASRIATYADQFGGAAPRDAYAALMARLVPIGFEHCDPGSWAEMPPRTEADRVYTPDEVRSLSYDISLIRSAAGRVAATVTILNAGGHPFAARSAVGKPLRLAWRYRDAAGRPMSGWDTRRDLPFDIPAHGRLQVVLPLDVPVGAAALELSMVQEFVFWFHDVGVAPRLVSLPRRPDGR
jgi:hypothetical protein